MRPSKRSGGQHTRIWGWAEEVGGGIVGYGHGPQLASSVDCVIEVTGAVARAGGGLLVLIVVITPTLPQLVHPRLEVLVAGVIVVDLNGLVIRVVPEK